MWKQIMNSGMVFLGSVLLYLSFYRTKPLLSKIRVLKKRVLALEKALAEAQINVVSSSGGAAEPQNENAAKWQAELPKIDSAVPIEILDDEQPTRRVTYEESVQLAALGEIAEPAQVADGKRLQRKRQACLLDRAGLSVICGLSVSAIRAYESGEAVLEPELLYQIEGTLDNLLARLACPDVSEYGYEAQK